MKTPFSSVSPPLNGPPLSTLTPPFTLPGLAGWLAGLVHPRALLLALENFFFVSSKSKGDELGLFVPSACPQVDLGLKAQVLAQR